MPLNYIVYVLAGLCAMLMVLERMGLAVTPSLTFKGDLKRETRFLAQYGQLGCTLVASILIWQLDGLRGQRVCKALWLSVAAATLTATILKRCLGRVRPRREHAGQFLGPTLKHDNYRESFPSSHSASAFAFSGILAMAYPPAAMTFWILALICAGLRYFMDAHWPSDVFGGIALGILSATISWRVFF